MDNPAVCWPRPHNHSADDPAHFRMSFGMMLATVLLDGRTDFVCRRLVLHAGVWTCDGGGGFVLVRCYSIRNRIRFRKSVRITQWSADE